MTMKKTLTAVAALAVLAACTTTSPDVIQRGDAQRLATVQDATVLSVPPRDTGTMCSRVSSSNGKCPPQ
jgi:outer membrane lipoprotein SlyB